MEEILSMDINKQVNIIKNEALKNKEILRNFLEGFIIDDGKCINDYINLKMLNEIENTDNPNYAYWVETGLTWLSWFQGDFETLSQEELNSINMHYFRFHYIFNNQDYKTKIIQLYNFVIFLKNLINVKLIEQDINFRVDIELKNIEVNGDGTLKLIYDNKTLFKEPSYNIRLIIIPNQNGGGRIKRRNRVNIGQYKILKKIIQKNRTQEIKINKLTFNELKNNEFNKKIVLEFYIEYYHTIIEKRKLDITKLKNYYLIINKEKYEEDKLKLLNREKLNRLNEIGMMTYCLLNISSIDDEFGLNVDKYRENIFFKNYKKNKSAFLKDLLEKYNHLFSGFKSHNVFFIDKINEYINKYTNPYFESFKNHIDNWFVSIFRPSINSFILEINEELLNRFNVRLFIAGGDAMRRYENNISFTKDIDTKLYINNIEIKDVLENQELNLKLYGKNIDEQKAIIKDTIVGIIVKYIVKLRNYLEQNIEKIFEEILRYDIRETNKGTDIISFKIDDNKILKVDILLDDENKKKYQQFRTRENKKRIDFPVDLYSIDFRTFIKEYEINADNELKEISKKSHDISILDVVLQDTDNFYDYYLNVVDGIPVASLEFLLEDFYKTYNTSDRALARISSGKVEKDIIRFNKIKELFINKDKIIIAQKTDIDSKLISKNIIYLKKLEKKIPKYKKIIEKIIIILNKIENKEPINMMDIGFFNLIINKYIFRYNRYLVKIINQIISMSRNFINEILNKTERDFKNFTLDNDIIRNGYYELFNNLCSMNNKDGLLRHVIMFSNSKILSLFKKMNIDNTISKPILKSSIRKRKVSTSVPVSVPTPTLITSSRGRSVKKVNYGK